MKDNKIRILYVTEAFDGGIYRFLLELSNQLENRAQIYIAYEDNDRTSMVCKDDFVQGIRLIPMTRGCSSHRNLNCLAGIRKYRNLVKQIQPDVVHVHSSVEGMWGRWAFVHNPCSTFYTPHGFAFLNDKPKWKMLIYRWIERISATRPCRIIACGMQEFQIAKSFCKDSLCVLNGINLKQLQLADDSADVGLKKQLEVLTVSRNVWQKNLDLFNAIAGRLPEVAFVWAGDEKKDDLDEFVNTILMVANEKEEKLQQIRMNAYQTVVDKYNAEKMADQYYDIYQEAVSNQKRNGIDRWYTG